MEHRLARLFMLALAGLLVSGTALAEPPPLGTDGHGVHIALQQGHPPKLVLTFDASAADRFRQIAGRQFDVMCVRFGRIGGRTAIVEGGGTSQPAPRRRQPIVVLYGRTRWDYCSVSVRHGRHTTVLTRIALTPLGAVRLDRLMTAETVIAAVRALGRPERPSATTVAARFHGVALASSAQIPAPGVLGVYSDGVAHVYAAQTDRAGELLFLEQDGSATRTNVFDVLVDYGLNG